MIDNVDDSNFMLFAAKHYINPGCVSDEEFLEDLSRIKNISRLLGKYEKSGVINERLILNHIIVLYNVFDATALTRMLAYKLDEQLDKIKPFLVLIGLWPDIINGVGGKDIIGSDVAMDAIIIDKLRKI